MAHRSEYPAPTRQRGEPDYVSSWERLILARQDVASGHPHALLAQAEAELDLGNPVQALHTLRRARAEGTMPTATSFLEGQAWLHLARVAAGAEVLGPGVTLRRRIDIRDALMRARDAFTAAWSPWDDGSGDRIQRNLDAIAHALGAGDADTLRKRVGSLPA